MATKPQPATKQRAINEGPQIAGAPPTSPSGMKRSDIRVELAERHSINMDTTRDLTLDGLVDLLVQSRSAREERLLAKQISEEQNTFAPAEQTEYAPKTKAAPKAKTKPADPGLCKHGEDPVLCEACEDEMLGDDEEDEVSDDLFLENEASADAEAEPEVSDDLIPDVAAMFPDSETEEEEDHQPVPQHDRSRVYAAVERAEAKMAAEAAEVDPDDEIEEWLTERDEVVASAPPSLFLGMPGVSDYSFAGHMGTGPSGADRWMNCTASLEMSKKFLLGLSQNQQAEFANANVAARQGTTAHAAAEVEARVILGEVTDAEAEHMLFDLAIDPPDGEDYNPEMAQFITEYTDLIQLFVTEGHEVLIEERVTAAVPLTAPLTLETKRFLGIDEDEEENYYLVNGSVDCGVMPTEEERVLTAVDLKYGEGKDVTPDSNPQVRLYMLGLLSLFIERGGDIDTLERLDYIIAQPRLGGIKAWTESVADLLTWRDEVLSPALTAALGLAPSEFSPGEQTCQWCPARGGCAALAGERLAAATELFTALDDAEFGDGPGVVASDLDNERLASLLKQITGLTDLQADLKAEAQRRLYRGETVPGMVLVNYTPPRQWKDGAFQFFTKNPALPAWKDPELRTPTQFVAAMSSEFDGKNAKDREAKAQEQYADLINVPEKRPVAAFEGDRRQLWQGKAPDQMFDIED